MTDILSTFNNWLHPVVAPVPVADPAPVALPAEAPVTNDAKAIPDYFDPAFQLLKGYEGPYGNDPEDPGNWTSGTCGVGECLGTNWGVDTASYGDILAKMPPAISATLPRTVKDLTIEQAEITYRYRYWNVVHADVLPPAVALVTFDSAVNSGTGRAAKWLQAAVGAVADGAIGPATMAAVHAACADRGPVSVASAILDTRLAFDQSLATFPRFGHGWTNRINDLRSRISTFGASAS